MKSWIAVFLTCISLLCTCDNVTAHFAMIIPSSDNVGKTDSREINLFLQFTHPFEGGPQMQMDKPEKFGVVFDDKTVDLTASLQERVIEGKSTWETSFKIAKPADYIFYLVPKPYYEPAEDKFIIHVTKVIVNGLGAEDSWDKPIYSSAGLPVEIVPLTRPYSLYAGNIFSGLVLRDGQPVPGAEIEVELWNKGSTKAATDSHITQVVKADNQGIFHYAMPKEGWWGFSAVMESPKPIQVEGKDKKVELGAVIWIKAHKMD